MMRSAGAVRSFRDDPVPDALLHRVLDTARFAPSGGNRQGWRVVLVRDSTVRRRLHDLARDGFAEYLAYVQAGRVPFAPGEDGRWQGPPPALERPAAGATTEMVDSIHAAPVLAVLCVDMRVLAVTDVDLERVSIVGGASIYPFAQNILLAARDVGLGAVMTTFICRREPQVRALLGLPPPYAIAGLLALGFSDHLPTRLRRRPVEEFTTVDRFDGPAFTAAS